jgi:putative hydrolase of the HAD superfamily
LSHRGRSRAVIFDLDDTLYPERRFALSGFAAVAQHTADVHGVPPLRAFAILRRAMRAGRRRRAFQDLAAECRLPDDVIPRCVDVYRRHEPRLRLPRASRRALMDLRPEWKIGILTNGDPHIQARKVAALGVGRHVDAVVFAEATGAAKPAACGFNEMLRRLEVDGDRAVFVGDHPVCDIAGARAVGMKTIRVRRRVPPADPAGYEADQVVDSMAMVPPVAAALVPERDYSHA